MVGHQFCYNCIHKHSIRVEFMRDEPPITTSTNRLDFCRCLDLMLTPEIMNVAFELECKFREVKTV